MRTRKLAFIFLSSVVLFLFFPLVSLASEGQECAAGERRVCFTDGGDTSCICKQRTKDLEDTPETSINCLDADDDGECEG